jgi:glycine/D-amino acid oxidase-like deaminating enzyme
VPVCNLVSYDDLILLSLHIVNFEPCHYRAHVMDGREELGTFDTMSISAAVREAAGHALPDLSGYHVWYEHVCARSCTPSNMRIDPESGPSG